MNGERRLWFLRGRDGVGFNRSSVATTAKRPVFLRRRHVCLSRGRRSFEYRVGARHRNSERQKTRSFRHASVKKWKIPARVRRFRGRGVTYDSHFYSAIDCRKSFSSLSLFTTELLYCGSRPAKINRKPFWVDATARGRRQENGFFVCEKTNKTVTYSLFRSLYGNARASVVRAVNGVKVEYCSIKFRLSINTWRNYLDRNGVSGGKNHTWNDSNRTLLRQNVCDTWINRFWQKDVWSEADN